MSGTTGTPTRPVGGLPPVATLPPGAEVVVLVPDATVSGGKAARRASSGAFQGPAGPQGPAGSGTGTADAVDPAALAVGAAPAATDESLIIQAGELKRVPLSAVAAVSGSSPGELAVGAALSATDEGVVIQGGELKRATLAALAAASSVAPGALAVAGPLGDADEAHVTQGGEVKRVSLATLAGYFQGKLGTTGGTSTGSTSTGTGTTSTGGTSTGGTTGGTSTGGTTTTTGGTTGSTAYVGPLDRYTSGMMPYSVARRLRSAYTGPAARARRSSDGAEADIGFTASGLLDTTALTSFVGTGGNGFVTKVYDQSGGGRDAVQPTAAKQPQIVVAGAVILTPGGRPALRFNGSTGEQCLVCGGLPAMTARLFAMFAVVPDAQQYGRLVRFANAGADAPALLYFAGMELTTLRTRADGTEALAKIYTLAAGTPYVVDAEYTGTEALVHVAPGAGLVLDEAATPFAETFGAAGGFVSFGSTDFGSGVETYNGLLSEWVFGHTPAAGERASIAADMRSAFGVVA